MVYRAAAAVEHKNRARAIAGLCGQLRIMAVAAGATLDWTTLAVAGPVDMGGTGCPRSFEWTASITVHGATELDALPDPDVVIPVCGVEDATMPLSVNDRCR